MNRYAFVKPQVDTYEKKGFAGQKLVKTRMNRVPQTALGQAFSRPATAFPLLRLWKSKTKKGASAKAKAPFIR